VILTEDKMRIHQLTYIIAGLLLSTPARSAESNIVYFQPMGPEIRDAEVQAAKIELENVYNVEVRILGRIPIPRNAYYSPRSRYKADILLNDLEEIKPADGWKIMGLTGADISTTHNNSPDWGVLGLGSLTGSASVISTYRCKKSARSPEQALERFAKISVHELGHTLGLEHCATHGCIMHDVEGKVSNIDAETILCPRCASQLGPTIISTL
jgi:archaemetzincin